jgi:hypothetical protein
MVESLSRPGGNITGFALYEYAIALKWLELLKEIATRHPSRNPLRPRAADFARIYQDD